MSSPSPQSCRTYAGLRWSLDRHQRPMHVFGSQCQVAVPLKRHRPKEQMVRTVRRNQGSSVAAIIAETRATKSAQSVNADLPCLWPIDLPLTGPPPQGRTFFCPHCGALYSVTHSQPSKSERNVTKCVV